MSRPGESVVTVCDNDRNYWLMDMENQKHFLKFIGTEAGSDWKHKFKLQIVINSASL